MSEPFTFNINPVFEEAITAQERYLLLYGGAGSGKSVVAAQKVLGRIVTEREHRILISRKVGKSIRKSQFVLLKDLISAAGMRSLFEIKESEMELRCRRTGNTIVSAGLDDSEKLKSITGITSAWIEEPTELTRQDFTQLDLRIRGLTPNYKQLVLTFNPISETHWLNNDFFIRTRDNTRIVHSTYRDNRFIDPEYAKVLEDLKETDPNLHLIYALGGWGILQNLVYRAMKQLETYPINFEDEYYGLDFGFNEPTALVHIGVRDAEYYTTELLYTRGLTNQDLIARMKDLEVDRRLPIYCDDAEPDRIREIRRAGFRARPCRKTGRRGKAIDRIDYVKRKRFYTRPDNTNLNKEWGSYKYREDKDGTIHEEPVKFNDHAVNAIEYAVFTHEFKRASEIKAEIVG